MSDWEDVPAKLVEKDIRQFADLKDGYAGGPEDPINNLKMIDEELARPNLHAVAREALTAERKKLVGAKATVSADDGWEAVPATTPSAARPTATATSGAGWEDVPAPAKKPSTFESGAAFKDTASLIPGVDDMKEAWSTFQKQWANRANTPITGADTGKMAKEEHAAGSGVLDLVGGLPAMVAGAAHGIWDGVTQGDASEGLKTAGNTMSNLLPSSLMGNKEDQEMGGYHTAMAPVTAVMDTLNAIPQGYGEMLNAGGADRAAGQVTDAGKLGIMATFGALGAKGVVKSMKGMKKGTAPEVDTPAKLEALLKRIEEEEAPAKATEGTVGHADDYAAVNPYDVGGHVTKSEQGRPSVIDEAQGDLFGSEVLEPAMAAPDVGQNSIRHETIPYAKEFPFELEPMTDGPAKLATMGKELNEFQPREVIPEGSIEPMIRHDGPLPPMNETRIQPEAVKTARESLQEGAGLDKDNFAMVEAFKAAERERAFSHIEKIAKQEKDAHFKALEDLETARRAGELDFQHAQDVVGDKSLMGKEHNIAMRGQLRIGDVQGALSTLEKQHPSAAYRELATYIKEQIGDLKVVMHNEPVLRMGDREVTGYYDAGSHKVGLSGLGATSPHTVLHELVHALTSRFINERAGDSRVRGINSLFTLLDKEGKLSKQFPGIVNAKEFVAEAFSNPKFQAFLKSQNMNNRSVWQRFVDQVKSLFNLKGEAPISTAFEHAMDLGKQIVEAQNGKQAALEQFKKAGLPGKLADLMATTPHDLPTRTKVHEGVEKTVGKIPGLENPISDFTFYEKPVAEIVEMAKAASDIPSNLVEKFAQQMQGGALFESLKTRNPVVKYTYERVTRAFQEAAFEVKKNLTNKDTGLKAFMRELTPTEKGEIHQAMMMAEGQKELTSADLAASGFNERQVAYAMRHRELDNQFFKQINERREALGMLPMDKRVAHIAGRFMGDFARMVFHDGKVVGRISGATRHELNKVTEYMKQQHPEWVFEKEEYNKIGHGRGAKDRFAGMMEAINFLEKSDSSAKTLMDSYKAYLQQDAVNYLNATRHAKDKVKTAGGIVGSEGHKPWLDAVKNAEEGMKAQLAYYEQGYQWMAMEKATKDIKELLGDEGVVKQVPNAVEYADKYVKHAMGRDQGKIADALNSIISNVGQTTGIGHSNLMKLNANVKHLIMQKFMGFANIPFTVTQLMQPLQTQPAMVRLLRSRGLEFSTSKAQMDAMNTYVHSMMENQGVGKLNKFESDAVAYADQMGIFDVKMADHTKDVNVSKFKEGFDKMADLNITAPEHFTRGTAFLFYSHLLKDAGVPVKDIFGAAENMTNMSMVNYGQIERPMGYAKLGWLGDVASTLTRYKHNQWSQVAFYAREGIRAEHGLKSSAPLATFLGSSLMFGGAMGFFAYQEADAMYQMFSEHVLKKPDSITNQILSSDLPEVVSHGVFSLAGMDMTTRFSNANAIPDSIPAALMPYGSAVMDMADSTGRFILDPTNVYKAKQAVKSVAPQSVQGALENTMFTTKMSNGNYMYNTPSDGPNLGKGRVERTESDINKRMVGFRNMRESKELAKNYSDSQIMKSHDNIAEKQITKAKYAALDDSLTPEKLQKLIQTAADHGMSPDAFVSQYTTWSMDRQLSQKQQTLLKNAKRGFTGAFKIKESQK